MIKYIYGSGSQGNFCEWKQDSLTLYSTSLASKSYYWRSLGFKEYDFKDHLGNVRAVFSDIKLMTPSGVHYSNTRSLANYYPFGMMQPGRQWAADSSMFGFQGQLKDDEVAGRGNFLNFDFRGYDSRTGRFWSLDPLMRKYCWQSPYVFSEDRVVDAIEMEGLESLVLTQYMRHINGTDEKLFSGITLRNGNWEGTHYRTGYYFEGKKDANGNYAYYEDSKEQAGTGIVKMMQDNPAYFEAKRMYDQDKKEEQSQKMKAYAGDGFLVLGGIISTVASGGSTSPFWLTFGVSSGVFQTGAGLTKLGLDIQGNYYGSNQMMTSPLGIGGRLLDESSGENNLFWQARADALSTGLSLGTAGWSVENPQNWNAINGADKTFNLLSAGQSTLDFLNKTSSDFKNSHGDKIGEVKDWYNKIDKADKGGGK